MFSRIAISLHPLRSCVTHASTCSIGGGIVSAVEVQEPNKASLATTARSVFVSFSFVIIFSVLAATAEERLPRFRRSLE